MMNKKCGLCDAQHEMYRLIDQNEESFSIIPTTPLKLGHAMVLPKRHVLMASDLSENELKSFFALVDNIKNMVKKSSNQDPILLINTGKHKTQDHFHLHIVPSRGNLRALIAHHEGIPERQEISKNEMKKMRNILLANK